MDKLGWFSNSDSYQREKINEAADEINRLRGEQAAHASSYGRLFALDRAQAEQILQLRVMVEVMAAMLAEAGVLDEKTLRYRVEAALADVDRPEPMEPVTTPYDRLGEVQEFAPAPVQLPLRDEPVQCARCLAVVLRSRTQVTEHGTVCDRCAAG